MQDPLLTFHFHICIKMGFLLMEEISILHDNGITSSNGQIKISITTKKGFRKNNILPLLKISRKTVHNQLIFISSPDPLAQGELLRSLDAVDNCFKGHLLLNHWLDFYQTWQK